MSRIGKKPIEITSGVSYTFDQKAGQLVVKGPKGELTQKLDPAFKLVENEGTLTVERPTEQKRHKALHGLYRSLIANMVEGVSVGYKKQLELVGVGYKASAQNNVLELSLGYSHNIWLAVPKEISVSAETAKGQNPIVTLESYDKQLIGQVAAKIKSLREVEPYKGKGIKFVGQYVRRKAGKQAAK
ncbi:50S ribosomal protein L6 [Fulvivirga lutimaris]|uniref:50S ribosomal protein L6 n=1 Tax=Fulvivirga lutimaris TaxID=1819566 RepID=UPI0012BD1891|nr:50S ribosomal protein L6 [Fulvivirga lutimaris]MTI41496.1 50S ribosomal protein L6 [Fulvivirga lutimaris]